jgi:DNA-binding response OmpR family regulator
MTVRILVIDNDQAAVNDLYAALVAEGYQPSHVLPGVPALRRVLADEPDLVILGIDNQKEDWQWCGRFLSFWDKPLLLLLSTSNKMDRIKGLDLGADDCMVKPANSVEVVARVRALLRRTESFQSRSWRSYLVDKDLVIDLTRREVWLDGRSVALTPTEYQLLFCFTRHVGEVLSHDRLARQIWGPDCPDDHTAIKQYVYQLRQKLEPDPTSPRRIISRRGQGYIFQLLTDTRADICL